MAPASARRATAPAPRPRRPAPRPQLVPGGGRGIRWDRLGRTALLLVLVGMVALYAGPLMGFWAARGQAAGERARVQQLRRENVALRARRTALRSPGTLEAEARRLGMVRPGEHPFVVQHLPGGP